MRLVLTSDQPWDVTAVEINDNVLVPTPIYENDDFIGTYNMKSTYIHYVNPSISSTEQADLLTLVQSKLAWIPMDIVERTLNVTTHLAKNYFKLPLKNHYKSRFPQLNRNRLKETLHTKATCMQIFVGRDSMYTCVYNMTIESQGPEMLERFISDVGAAYTMMSDNAKMQTSRAWTSILRKYNINLHTSEAYNQHQNYAERRIQEVKKETNCVMDHTNAPDTLWSYATKFALDVLNHSASKTLNWKTPLERAFGITPDISALIQFSFFEPIYYHDSTIAFPSSRELPGRFLGLAHPVGDALTYYVLTEANTVIARSVLRSALDLKM